MPIGAIVEDPLMAARTKLGSACSFCPGYLAENHLSAMLDQVIASLKQEAMPELMSKLGLDSGQADRSVQAAGSSLKEVLSGNHGFALSDLAGLFNTTAKSGGADAVLAKLGTVLQGKLTGQAGLGEGQATDVRQLLMPLLTNVVAKHVGGDASKLQALLGGNGGDLAEKAKGLLGGLFKK